MKKLTWMVLYSGLVSVVVCVLLVVAISRPFRGFPSALGCFSGLQGGYLGGPRKVYGVWGARARTKSG